MDKVLADIIKNSNAYKVFDRDIEKCFCHAYLIESVDTVASDMLLTLVSQRVFCKTACQNCDDCRKVAEGLKPDVKVLNPDGENVTVEQVSDMINDSYLAPVEKGEKLYIVKSMDKQSVLVQNKLLKTLEEPPENVHILFTATSSASVLQTVSSRAKKVSIAPFGYDDVYRWLSSKAVFDPKEIAIASGGNLTVAYKIFKDDGFIESARNLLSVYNSIKDSSSIPKALGNKVFDDLKSALDISELIFNDVLYVKSELEKGLVFSSFGIEYRELANSLTMGGIAEIMSAITVAKQKMSFSVLNLNILDCFLLKIAEEKSKCKKLSV